MILRTQLLWLTADTSHETDDHQPAFSPGGARIAFRSERDGGGIYIMPALAGKQRLLVQNGVRPRFSGSRWNSSTPPTPTGSSTPSVSFLLASELGRSASD